MLICATSSLSTYLTQALKCAFVRLTSPWKCCMLNYLLKKFRLGFTFSCSKPLS